MSIATAFSNALSGLSASARQAEVLSSNVSNASTPGYVRREVALAVRDIAGVGQGVRVTGTRRDVDLYLLNDRRAAQADAAGVDTRAAFLSRLEAIHGTAQDSGSLLGRINGLETALLSASARPESEAALSAAVTAAARLVEGITTAGAAVQAERLAADDGIASAVAGLNTTLEQVRDLNIKITAFSGAGRDASALMDQRAQLVDSIGDLIPLREVQRADGQIALISTGGAVLLDGKAAVLGFTPVHAMVAETTMASGALSGLTLNGAPMAVSGPASRIGEGRLAAFFTLRDDLGPAAQAQLDALARDLVERFSAPGVDPTLPTGAPGLFTDAGNALDPAQELGIAGRLALNPAVDPKAGGMVTRLRDGLGAATPGPTGQTTTLTALSLALSSPFATGSTTISPGLRSASSLAAELLSKVATARVGSETEQSFTNARLTALEDMESEGGVDVDAEMQSLLVIEKNYAANARVIQALDEMLKSLLGL